ncbi:hypothetical protein BDR07DRAFT_1380567 [Suillus spraguei]|nr:hypothetical protein BDR07DRAFT_1380567 [Suillus spraguei]
MKASRSMAKITGQLLTIIPTHLLPDVPQSFLWNGGYVTARLVIQGIDESTAQIVVITACNEFCQVNGSQSTWQISYEALQAACDILWAKAIEIKVMLKTVTAVTPLDVKNFLTNCQMVLFPFFLLRQAVSFALPKGKQFQFALSVK